MELSIDQALIKGVEAHKAGKLEEADRYYTAILKAQPKHPDANHNMGVLAVGLGKVQEALPFFRTALDSNPNIEQFWLSYIDALINEQKFDNAKQVIEQAKKEGVDADRLNSLEAQISPKRKKPDNNKLSPPKELINRLFSHYQNRRFSEAEKLAVQIIKDFPKHQFVWKVLGAVLGTIGRNSEAADAYQTVVMLSPQDAQAHSDLGNTLQELGRWEEAEASYNKAIALKPDYAEAHYNLGVALKELRRWEEAETSYNQAIALNPDLVEAHTNLGNTLQELGRWEEAEASYNKAITLKPDFAEAHSNLGNTLQALGRWDESIESYKRALAIKPNDGNFLRNISTAKTKAVPFWHIPMMNEHRRNEAYKNAICSAIKKDDLVLDIGTGSGLLSMIAADCGAREVITCETSSTISKIAEKIIHKNGFGRTVKVINKNSKDLVLGQDISRKVDILVSEILSSEFVGEGIQTTVLDAKRRLLKKNGRMIPEGGSIMIALIENTGKLSKELFVESALNFDVSDFNSIIANKCFLKLEDRPILLSDPIEAFTFDFCNFEKIYRDKKTIKICAKRAGVCAGVIQWLKVNLYDEIDYENNPVEMYRLNSVSGWKTPIFKFNNPINVTVGQSLNIQATLNEDQSWFHLDCT